MTTSESADNFVVCLTFTPEGITCTFAEERKYLLAIFQVKVMQIRLGCLIARHHSRK